MSEAARRFLGSPRVWRCHYDGVTEIGSLKVGAVSAGQPAW